MKLKFKGQILFSYKMIQFHHFQESSENLYCSVERVDSIVLTMIGSISSHLKLCGTYFIYFR